MSWFRARRCAPGVMLAAALASVGAGAGALETSTAPTVILAPGYSTLNFPAPQPGTYQLPPIAAAADAPYLDSQGARGTLHTLFADRITLLSFIYTECDDVNGCPLATFVLGQLAKRLAADPRIGPRLRLISYSFDPAHDTPDVLEQYAKPFRPPGVNWNFVTAPDSASLAPTLAAYQQSIRRTGGRAYAHILRVFLIDGQRRVRNIYSPAFLHADSVAADIETLLLEPGALTPTSIDRPAPTGAGAPPASDDRLLGLPPPGAGESPATAAQITLGERLFFDRRLSLNRTLSCAMCHVPAQGFTVNSLATAVGIEGRTVKRNAPSLLNVGLLGVLFHDGRERRLEQQVWGPLLASNEMANPSIGYVVDNLARWPEYRGRFEAAFGSGPGMETIGRALAAYERTLLAGGSAFDRWYYAKDEHALDPAAQRGFAIFRGKGHCVACHSVGPQAALFTDEKLHNTGLGYLASMAPAGGRRESEIAPGTTLRYDLAAVARSAETPPHDLGRYEITQDPQDRWRFLTPSLRNVALTAPYMHNGVLSTLAAVVAFYNDGGVSNELLDPAIKPLGLNAQERTDLIAFLLSLTSPAVAGLVEHARAVEIGNPGGDGR